MFATYDFHHEIGYGVQYFEWNHLKGVWILRSSSTLNKKAGQRHHHFHTPEIQRKNRRVTDSNILHQPVATTLTSRDHHTKLSTLTPTFFRYFCCIRTEEQFKKIKTKIKLKLYRRPSYLKSLRCASGFILDFSFSSKPRSRFILCTCVEGYIIVTLWVTSSLSASSVVT